MFFSVDAINEPERVPLTKSFNRSGASEDQAGTSFTNNNNNNSKQPTTTTNATKKKDYTPIVHTPWGVKTKPPPVVHSPPPKPKPVEPKKKKKVKRKVEIKEPPKIVEPTPPPPAPVKPGVPTHLDGTPLRSSEVALLKGLICKWKNYSNHRKGGEGSNQFRKGPAPLDELSGKNKRKFVIRCSHGTLDSDIESDEEEIDGVRKGQKASCKSLILYFAKLAVSNNEGKNSLINHLSSFIKSKAAKRKSLISRIGWCVAKIPAHFFYQQTNKLKLQTISEKFCTKQSNFNDPIYST